jgi:hypothetical protein
VRLALAILALVSGTARADVLNHELLRKHVGEELAHVDVASLSPAQREALYADRLSLTLGLFVPVLGTYRMEGKMFGVVRPAGVIFDWFLGGAVPAGLAIAALATDGRTRKICAWTAFGLYATTRIGVFAIGSSHISAYNDEVDVLITFSSRSR